MNLTTGQADKYQGLFNYLNDQYGLVLTINGMNDLIAEVNKAKQLILPVVSQQSEPLFALLDWIDYGDKEDKKYIVETFLKDIYSK